MGAIFIFVILWQIYAIFGSSLTAEFRHELRRRLMLSLSPPLNSVAALPRENC